MEEECLCLERFVRDERGVVYIMMLVTVLLLPPCEQIISKNL